MLLTHSPNFLSCFRLFVILWPNVDGSSENEKAMQQNCGYLHDIRPDTADYSEQRQFYARNSIPRRVCVCERLCK